MNHPIETNPPIGSGEIRYRLLTLIRSMTIQPGDRPALTRFNEVVAALIDAIVEDSGKNRQIKEANQLVGAQNSDIFIERLHARILSDEVLAANLNRMRSEAGHATITAFAPPAIGLDQLLRTDSIEAMAALLRLPAALDPALENADREVLAEAVGKLADPESNGVHIGDIPPPLRDHVKDLLIDRASDAAAFIAALRRIGPVRPEPDGLPVDSQVLIDRFTALKNSGGPIDGLPDTHDIRTKICELLTRYGGKLIMKDGTTRYVPAQRGKP